MRVDQFDFVLPEERIALRPAVPRDSARLLVVDSKGAFFHRTIRDLPDLLLSGDEFRAFARPARKLVEGDQLSLGHSLVARVRRRYDAGEIEVQFALSGAELDREIAEQ